MVQPKKNWNKTLKFMHNQLQKSTNSKLKPKKLSRLLDLGDDHGQGFQLSFLINTNNNLL
jgi:hypothetical protein